MVIKMKLCKCDEALGDFVFQRQDVRIRLQIYNDRIFRVTQTPNPEFCNRDYNIVTAVKAENCADFRDTGDAFLIATPQMTVLLHKDTGNIDFSDKDGYFYQRDLCPCSFRKINVTKNIWDESSTVTQGSNIDGARSTADGGKSVFDRVAYQAAMPLSFDENEAVLGFGSFEEGYGNLRGKKQYLYQENMRAFVPMFVSTRGYGVLINNGGSMIFDDKVSHTLELDCADEADYYFIGGGTHRAVLEGYYFLTGKPPMMPKYLFGYAQSKERYANADELVDIVGEYRRRNIPLDIIVQDWLSWEDGKWGQKTFDRSRYPDPCAMTAELHRQNSRLMISIWPIMTGEGENRAQMLAHGLMLGNRASYNAFLPAARQLYWEQAKCGLFDFGVDCWWCDCTEPFEADWSGEIKPDPPARYAINTDEAKKFIEHDKISLYSLFHSQGIYEGMRGCSDRRVVNLTRSSYAGQHRYSTVTWSGDVSAKWETLKHQIPDGVNFTCTGEPYWAFDTGGFFVKKQPLWFCNGDYDNGVDDLGYRELYVRWLEYGTFTPMLRSHGTDTPREIWRFGEEGTPFYDAIAKYIRLRYTLIPYLYSLAADVSFRAGSIMKPLALGFPDDNKTHDILDQYLFGDFMVCPVTEPMYYAAGSVPLENHQKSRAVYLPQGSWYDYHTNEKLQGGITIHADAPLDIIPLYVHAGTILVTAPVMQYVNEIENPPLSITIYEGANGEFILYNDDDETYAYESGEFEQIKFSWDDGAKQLTIAARDKTYPNMPQTRKFDIYATSGFHCSVTYSGDNTILRLKD